MSDALAIKYTAEVTLTDLSDPGVSYGWTINHPYGGQGSLAGSPVSLPLIPRSTYFKGEGSSPQEALQSLTEALKKELAKHDSRADRVAAALKATKDGLPAPIQRHLVS
jgi:hypothetical protein